MSRLEGLLGSECLSVSCAQPAKVYKSAALSGPHNPGRLAEQGYYYPQPKDEETEAQRYSISSPRLYRDVSPEDQAGLVSKGLLTCDLVSQRDLTVL